MAMVCMKLHSLCLDKRAEAPNHHFVEGIVDNDEWVVFDNASENDSKIKSRSSGESRREL
jgi:hypothetical protein